MKTTTRFDGCGKSNGINGISLLSGRRAEILSKIIRIRLEKTAAVFLLLIFFSAGSNIRANAQSKQKTNAPASAAGRRLAEFLRAYNTGDKNVIKQFFVEHFDISLLEKLSADERTSTAASTFDITRRLKLHSVEQRGDYEVIALCQSEITEAWFSLTIRLASESPHGIIKQAFGFAGRPADAVPRGRLSRAQIIRELNIYLAKLAAAKMISGVVLLAENNKPIFRKAYGFDASKKPNRIDTQFDLASLVKMFTSVAIAQLAQQGKLSYGDSIGKFLPDYPNKQAAEKVTIHHLLTHTSGLTEYSDKEKYRPARNAGVGFKTLKDWFPFFAADPLSFSPGEKSEYDNSNFIVLGTILETVTQQNYFDYVRNHIFELAGMNNTILTVEKGNSAGGGLSTIEDLFKFSVALRKHTLLNADYTNIIFSPKVKTGEAEAYGYGFEVFKINGKRIVGHSGGGMVDNQLDIYLDENYTAVISVAPFTGRNITRKLRELITQE